MRRRAAAAARQLASRAGSSAPLAPPTPLAGAAASHARVSSAAAAPRWLPQPLLPPAARALSAPCSQRRSAHGRSAGEEAAAPSAAVSAPPVGGRDAGGASAPADVDDAPPRSWLDDTLPSRAVPYAKLARLDAPAGTWLLLWPCTWSLALAAPAGSPPDAALLALFSVGALLLRGAGCTVNDLWDRDIDRLVARTRHRPLASGAVSPAGALVFLGAQLGVGLGVLLQLNTFSQLLGASSLGLVAAYPLMKRITNWPQAFLGLTFNWGALLGWAAARGELDLAVVLPLYGAGVAWTLVYDTIYAHQDVVDDARVGVRSTALHFGANTQRWLAGFGAAMVAGLSAAGYAADVGPLFYAGVAGAGMHLAHQVATVDLADRADCAAKFRSNVQLGALVFVGAVADRLAAHPEVAATLVA